MRLWASAPRVGVQGLFLCAALLCAPLVVRAHHFGEALVIDQRLVSANNGFLAALAQWEKLPPSLKSSNMVSLVQLAQARQQQLIALVQADAKVAAARMLTKQLRARVPAQAAVYIEVEVRVQGTGFISVADNFASNVSHATFKVLGNAGEIPQTVYLADTTGTERDLHKMAGKKLTFDAMRVGDFLVLLDKKKVQAQQLQAADGTITSPSALAAAGPVVQGDQKTLSILVNFNDKPIACTAADVSNRVFGTSGATVNTLYKDSSRGLVGFSGSAVGPYTINYSSTGTCDHNGWAVAAEAAARAAGVDPSQYARVNYVTPGNYACGWAGMAYMPGRQSWVQACASTGVYAHELGHNISLHHAATQSSEYGDASDPMGGGEVVGLNGPNRVMAGWQPSGTVLDVASGGSYSIATVSNSTIEATPQVLRLVKADTAEYYYVSLRQAMAHDTSLNAFYVNGLSVHRAAGSLPTKTYLLNVLASGQSFNDPTNGITITNQGVSNSIAGVAVTMTAGTCARSAPSVSLTPPSQSAGAGNTINYAMKVQNNNTPACGTSTFNLSQAVPTGFIGALSAASMELGAGASGSVNWAVTSAIKTTGGTYGLDAIATEAAIPNSTSTAHATYILVSELTAPAVSIASPINGAVLSGGKPLSISVSADDASGIQAVEIYVDGALLARDTGVPFTASWGLRKAARGAHTIKARAIDNAGNASEQSITVTLQ